MPWPCSPTTAGPDGLRLWALELVSVELVEDEEDDEEDDGDELLEELSVVEALEELVWVLEVELELDPLDVWVIVELELSVAVVEEVRVGPAAPPGGWRGAPRAGVSWPPTPTAVRPPPANAESAARRAQRRATLIGDLPC